MAANPRTVAVDTYFLWDGVTQRLAKGQVLDVTPGGALERAIGADRLVPLGPTPAPSPAGEAVPQGGGGGGEFAGSPLEASGAAPPKFRTVARKPDDGKDGDA